MKRSFVAIACFLACSGFVQGASPDPDADKVPVIQVKTRTFRIPFNIDEAFLPRYEWLELWLSRDEGKTWKCVERVNPATKSFVFRSDRDGLHCFAVRTCDSKGRLSPSSDKDFETKMKVLIEPRTVTRTEPAPETTAPQVLKPVLDLRVATSLARSHFAALGLGGFAGLR